LTQYQYIVLPDVSGPPLPVPGTVACLLIAQYFQHTLPWQAAMKQSTLSGFVTGGTAKKRKCGYGLTVCPTVENSKFAPCPLCQSLFPIHVLVSHAGACNGTVPRVSSEQGKREHNSSAQVAKSEDERDLKEHPPEAPEDSTQDTKFAPPWWINRKPQPCLHTIENPIGPSSEPIAGLHLYREFITEEEEQQILSELDGIAHPVSFLPWQFSRFNGRHLNKRWGVHCNLRDRRVGPAENSMPPFFCNILLPKLKRVLAMKSCTPNEANAIDYHRSKGDYLEDHVDDRQLSKEPIANLSLGGDCYMTFINQKTKLGSSEPLRVMLPRRTLQVLTGNARYDYSHGIRNQDLLDDRRVSVTMRESPLSKTT
jgi:alkylated DNA repair dioxygenase AlkB